MNIKRSYLQLFLGSVTVGLFLANCTVQQAKDDGSCAKGDVQNGCACPDGSVGYQKCTSEGVFGSCVCPASNSGGGASNTGTAGKTSGNDAGATSTPIGGKTGSGTAGSYTAGGDGGAAPIVDPAAGGAGGAGGAPGLTFDPEDCESCLAVLCKNELDTCLADDTCFQQYADITDCINGERATGLAKRDVVRGCGVNVGTSPNASLQSFWGDPQTLAPETTNLLNCMATSSSETPSSAWANDLATNFPNNMPAPWPADSCAKLSCTSKFQ